MKKTILLISMILMIMTTAIAIAGTGNSKAKLGPCVKECVQTYNPGLAESGAETFLVTDINGAACVEACKADTTDGVCSPEEDGCCNILFETSDPDCGTGDFLCGQNIEGTDVYCPTEESCNINPITNYVIGCNN